MVAGEGWRPGGCKPHPPGGLARLLSGQEIWPAWKPASICAWGGALAGFPLFPAHPLTALGGWGLKCSQTVSPAIRPLCGNWILLVPRCGAQGTGGGCNAQKGKMHRLRQNRWRSRASEGALLRLLHLEWMQCKAIHWGCVCCPQVGLVAHLCNSRGSPVAASPHGCPAHQGLCQPSALAAVSDGCLVRLPAPSGEHSLEMAGRGGQPRTDRSPLGAPCHL